MNARYQRKDNHLSREDMLRGKSKTQPAIWCWTVLETILSSKNKIHRHRMQAQTLELKYTSVDKYKRKGQNDDQ